MSSSISNSKQPDHGHQRHASKLCVLFISIAIAGIVLSLLASEWILRTQVQPNDNFAKQVAFYRSLDPHKPIRIAAFGDSHTSQGFAAKGNDINLGMSGEGFDQIAVKIEAVLQSHTPEIIILQIAPHMFASYRVTDYKRNYRKFFDKEYTGINLSELMLVFDPVYRVRLLFYWERFLKNHRVHSKKFHFTDNGHVFTDHSMPDTEDQFAESLNNENIRRVKQHSPVLDRSAEQLTQKMQATIESILAQNIKLCIVDYPVTPVYRRLAGQNPNFEKAFSKIEAMAADYSLPRFSYYDMTDEYTNFRNLDHVNGAYAQVLTDKMIADCLSAVKNSP